MNFRSIAWTEDEFQRGRTFDLASTLGVMMGAVLAIALIAMGSPGKVWAQPSSPRQQPPELNGGGDWLGVSKPLTLQELRGKIVLIDFWTLCCINCMQTLPEIAKLEKKYPQQLVVLGVHTPKFENERNPESVRQAMLRYEIAHPVLTDPDRNLWRKYGVQGWPSLILIDPEGFLVGRLELERPKNYEVLDQAINQTIRIHRAKKTLNEELLPFQKAQAAAKSGPLYFPGNVLADEAGSRLFIADSTHHRLVVTDLEGKRLAIVGTGTAGKTDGAFEKAQFSDPQGMALRGEVLYVADRKNHLIRAVDLKGQTVKTVAGIGSQGLDRTRGGAALKTGLNSPWALHLKDNRLFIANAGSNQLWVLDLSKAALMPFAGTSNEDIIDGARYQAGLAQPSALTSDGTQLYFADSETSSIRCVPLDGRGPVRTLVGKGMFDYGDRDGTPEVARLQHPLGVVYSDGILYIADTYNHKIKTLDPRNGKCSALAAEPADSTDTGRMFNEPGGISFAAGKLYIADTNAHRIRVLNVKTRQVSTLPLTSVSAP
jgi:thiol-disulfide isomerase/thioredoxin